MIASKSDFNRFYNESELAAECRIARATLEKWRREGKGPPYIKLGKRVVYRASAVEAWLEEQTVGAAPARKGR